jgi:hypothetical protein
MCEKEAERGPDIEGKSCITWSSERLGSNEDVAQVY